MENMSEHKTWVQSTNRGYRPMCSCGWEGCETDRMSNDYAYTNASDDARQHERKELGAQMSITDERLRWISRPDYIRSEPGQIAAALLVARDRIRELEAEIAAERQLRALEREVLVSNANRIAQLKAGIAEWASECADCNGRGFFLVRAASKLGGNVQQDCHSCANIRAMLPDSSAQNEGGK
jgi:hypothetical protein